MSISATTGLAIPFEFSLLEVVEKNAWWQVVCLPFISLVKNYISDVAEGTSRGSCPPSLPEKSLLGIPVSD